MNFKEEWNKQANLIAIEIKKRLSMQKYLVKYEDNYGDEFDVYGLAVLTQEDKDYFDNLKDEIFPLVHYIGTNEDIQYGNKEQLLSNYTWTKINEGEARVIAALIGSYYGHFYYPEVDEDEELFSSSLAAYNE